MFNNSCTIFLSHQIFARSEQYITTSQFFRMILLFAYKKITYPCVSNSNKSKFKVSDRKTTISYVQRTPCEKIKI